MLITFQSSNGEICIKDINMEFIYNGSYRDKENDSKFYNRYLIKNKNIRYELPTDEEKFETIVNFIEDVNKKYNVTLELFSRYSPPSFSIVDTNNVLDETIKNEIVNIYNMCDKFVIFDINSDINPDKIPYQYFENYNIDIASNYWIRPITIKENLVMIIPDVLDNKIKTMLALQYSMTPNYSLDMLYSKRKT